MSEIPESKRQEIVLRVDWHPTLITELVIQLTAVLENAILEGYLKKAMLESYAYHSRN